MSLSLIFTAGLAIPALNAAPCFSSPTFKATDVAGGLPAADRIDPISSLHCHGNPFVSFLPGLALAFDSQSQTGSATKIVGQACAEANSDKSMQLPRENNLFDDENNAIYITDSINNTNKFTLIYNGGALSWSSRRETYSSSTLYVPVSW
jgi:hypothetical protein